MRRGCLTVWLLLLLIPALAQAARRPAPLPDEVGCDHYRGTSSGNDPSVRLDVILCPHEDGSEGKVTGKLQWSSTESGWNLRQLEGEWTGDALTMKDLKILEEKPATGFRFCAVDSYALTRKGDGTLEGTYDSEACDDHATVSLVPMGADEREQRRVASGRPTSAPASSGGGMSTSDPRPESGAPKGSGGCRCDLTSLMLLPLLGMLPRSTRRLREPR